MDSQRRKPVVPRAETPELRFEVQYGEMRGIARHEKLKRLRKQHPQRDIPRVDSTDER